MRKRRLQKRLKRAYLASLDAWNKERAAINHMHPLGSNSMTLEATLQCKQAFKVFQ